MFIPVSNTPKGDTRVAACKGPVPTKHEAKTATPLVRPMRRACAKPYANEWPQYGLTDCIPGAQRLRGSGASPASESQFPRGLRRLQWRSVLGTLHARNWPTIDSDRPSASDWPAARLTHAETSGHGQKRTLWPLAHLPILLWACICVGRIPAYALQVGETCPGNHRYTHAVKCVVNLEACS
jgi:hypothetical protein